MRSLLNASLFLVFTGSAALAAPTELEFNGDFLFLPQMENGFEISGNGAIIEDGLASENFDSASEMIFTRNSGFFSLLSFTMIRGVDFMNQFRLVGLLDGMTTWEGGPFDYGTGDGDLLVDGFATPYFDEFRIIGIGVDDEFVNNIVYFQDYTFDVVADLPTPPAVPLPAGMVLMLTAFGCLSLRKLCHAQGKDG